MSDLFDLSGKVALVTGGSRGLGQQMVKAFAARGADVIIASRKIESCEALAAEIEKETGQQAMAHAVNVSHWDQMDDLAKAAYDRFGKVDILVNNAGMSPLYEKITDVTEALYDKVLDVNLKGPFRLSAVVGSRMAEDDGGSIINISSIASHHPTADVIPYAAAKAGLNAMTQGYARAFGPNVRVNCIVCGAFRTDISKAWDIEAAEARARNNFALQRIGEPNEVVGAALYFASNASAYTTGALLDVDGGR
ncbi:MAG: SDR family NAD(P)-dependent oxidoreductase [Alphaproteobacteria bacterium]